MKEFENKVVVVTGGTAGNGRAIAELFAEHGAHIGIIARDTGRLRKTEQLLEMKRVNVHAVSADVADAKAIDQAAEKIEESLGPIDIWINNAMTAVFAPISETNPEEFKRVTEVTYLGYVYGTLAALKRMRPRNKGHIIQVGSALAYRGIPLQASYCAAKHAIKGFQDSLRTELMHEKSNIKTTMVQLPAHNTPQFEWVLSRLSKKPQPVPPIFSPYVAAGMVLYAAENKPSEVLGGLPVLQLIWGSSFLPQDLFDTFLYKSGYSGQLTNETEFESRPSNLYEPVSGDYAAEGRYTNREHTQPQAFWFVNNRYFILSAVAIILLLLAVALV